MTEGLVFEIPGPPVAKQRPRRAKNGHFYTPSKTVRAEEAIGWAAKAAGLKLGPGLHYAIRLAFHVARLHRDGDNLEKCVLDGLGTMYKKDGWNDRQVISMVWEQRLVADAREEKTVVWIKEV